MKSAYICLNILTEAMLKDVFKHNSCLQITMKYTILLPSSAKPQLQLCWLAELALISVNPATRESLFGSCSELNKHSGVQ